MFQDEPPQTPPVRERIRFPVGAHAAGQGQRLRAGQQHDPGGGRLFSVWRGRRETARHRTAAPVCSGH